MKTFSFLVLLIFINNALQSQIYQEGFHVQSTFPTSAAFGDFDGDGDIDFVQAFNQYTGSNSINANKIWLNNGDNTFTLYDTLGLSQTEDIETADIDNDGDLDIIAGNTDVSSVSRVWINDGNANFTQGQSLGSQGTSAVVVEDFNEDGFIDVFLGTYELGTDDVLYMNDGNGVFTLASIPWSTGSRTTDAEAIDINNDGHMDIIMAKGNVSLDIRKENEVWTGFGDGTFFKSPQMLPLIPSWSMAVGDYNGDDYVDVIFQDNTLTHGYLNDGSSLFNISEVLNENSASSDVDLVDVDNDGDLDLILAIFSGVNNYYSEIHLNDGSGNFTDGIEQFSMADTFEIEYYDIDHDNDIDLLTINKNNQDNVFWINQTDPPLLIEGVDKLNMVLFPNPAQDILNIESQQPLERLKIYSLQGQLLKEDSSSSVDVSQLASGLYFVQVTIGGQSVTKKFIKE